MTKINQIGEGKSEKLKRRNIILSILCFSLKNRQIVFNKNSFLSKGSFGQLFFWRPLG